MKKKLFYLFATLLLVGICAFMACKPFLVPGEACECTYDGKYPTTYGYDWMTKNGYKYCDDLQTALQENEDDHRVKCVKSKDSSAK